MFIIKRDGTKQKFDRGKINKAIEAAFSATDCICPTDPAQYILCKDGDSVEEIQDRIET